MFICAEASKYFFGTTVSANEKQVVTQRADETLFL